jgi:peptidoglycan/LPS O-acetylase OafA/YrhL
MIKAIAAVGWIGVSFFFILSGFVLRWTFDPKMSWGRFVSRRVSRIYPLHWLGLILSVAGFYYFGEAIGGYRGGRLATIANVLLVQDWIPGHPEIRQSWNGVSWTLSAEMFFYLLAPLIFAASAPESLARRTWLIAGLWTALLIVSITTVIDGEAMKPLGDFLLAHPLPRLLEFVAGSIGAEWVQRDCRPKFTLPLVAVFLVAAGVFVRSECTSFSSAYLGRRFPWVETHGYRHIVATRRPSGATNVTAIS